jgi:hypothetical protein
VFVSHSSSLRHCGPLFPSSTRPGRQPPRNSPSIRLQAAARNSFGFFDPDSMHGGARDYACLPPLVPTI